jgi:hypothetical protein
MNNSEFLKFDKDYAKRQAFKNNLQEMYYNAVVLNDQDMLIDSNDQVVLFESKLIMRKYTWDERTQSFNKVPTGVRKSIRKDEHISSYGTEEESSNFSHQEEEEVVS